MPYRGSLLEAVTREPARAPEPLDVVDRPKYRLVFGRDLVEARHGAELAGARDGAVEHVWCGEVAIRRLDAGDARAISDDGRGRDPFHELHAQPPARAGVSGGDRVRARDSVAGAEGGAEDVVAGHQRRELAHLGRVDPPGVVQVVLVPHGDQA